MDGDGWDDLDVACVEELLDGRCRTHASEQASGVFATQSADAWARPQVASETTFPSFEVYEARRFLDARAPFLGGAKAVDARQGLTLHGAIPVQNVPRAADVPSSSAFARQDPPHTAAAQEPLQPLQTAHVNETREAPRQMFPLQEVPTHAYENERERKQQILSGDALIGPGSSVDFRLPSDPYLKSLLDGLDCLTWISGKKVWRTNALNYEKALRALRNLPSVQLRIPDPHDLPLHVLKVTAEAPNETDRFEMIPAPLREALMAFQRDGVRFALQRGTRVLIGDEMGLGKTVQAIALLAAHTEKWPALIVCPSSLRDQWADALHQWLGITQRRMQVLHTGRDVPDVTRSFAGGRQTKDFLIVSYNFVSKIRGTLEEANFRFVVSFSACAPEMLKWLPLSRYTVDLSYQGIDDGHLRLQVLDESHYIKDPKAIRTKDTLPLVQRAECAALLTGTPMLSRPKEMFTQLSALVPTAKLKFKDFGERYCLSTNQRFGKYEGCRNHEELNRLLTSTVMIRRLKKDVLEQLPPKQRQQIFLSLDKPERDKLERQTTAMDAARSLADSLGDGDISLGCLRQEQRRMIMDLYRLTAEAKVKAVQQYVAELLDLEQKFLIFCHHRIMNDGIAEILNKKSAKHICIDGSVAPEKRQKLVDNFQCDHTIKVALLSIKAAGVGLTLTAASMVVFAELAWSPGEIVQAEDRAHRIGQPSSVNVYFLHVKQSIDDIMWSLLQSKLGTIGQAIDGCKETFRLEASVDHRESGQGSLRPFLTAVREDTALVDKRS